MRVLVCLPTYNEEKNVAYMLKGLREEQLDVVVCDGHSTDRTVAIAEEMGAKVLMRDGFGKGAAIITTVAYAVENGYDLLATIDCDRTYDYRDIRKLLEYTNTYDMVVGARPMENIAFLRRMANYLMTGVMNVLFLTTYKDMATGLRVFEPAKFQPFLDAESFDIEPQIYTVALREGYPVLEVPVEYAKRVGDSKIRLRHMFLIIWRMIRERMKKRSATPA